ncbi:DUF1552 domain-containing protein [Phenylobacterium sp. SCN 70-31]|uniref:DUF1552 domain-containing protein n=1 Tax=Phenylobacterium sp. SCN 70-31 TaxID=1660129 RepID=UPI00086A4594|nr:DUF1552 domain-containing protein [Phenylobacterium sp. SCN 70-31]ODT89646.1 MAG: hypothetical protein ABS78_02165 [Phenylobacterium sp. SCN 70-31]
MIIARRHLSRRALLRGGAGIAIALPFLDAMHPALAAERTTAAAPVRRLGVVYYPHGVVADRWTPTDAGGTLKLGAGLAPLEGHKQKLLFVTGMSSDPDREKPGFHDRAVTSWLTGVEMARDKVNLGPSMDQLAAAKLSGETQFGSLELSTEAVGQFGGVAYRDATTPLPYERNPRIVFERLFGDGGKVDAQAVARRDAMDQSTLDSVVAQIGALKRRLGPADRRKLDQYLDSIRDVERRIRIASERTAELPEATRPPGVPDSWVEHVKLMFDLQVLAYQADLTRVVTFMTQKEASTITFPHLNVSMQHHEASHHNYDPAKLEVLHRVNVTQSELFAYYLSKLDSIDEAGGTLLDNSLILFGSSLSNPTVHSQRDLPVMLAGGAAGRVRGGRMVKLQGDTTPLTNLHLSLLDQLGIPTEKLGDSTGMFNRLGI